MVPTNELLGSLRLGSLKLVIIKTRIIKLIKDNELNIKLGSVRYMFVNVREQLVKKIHQKSGWIMSPYIQKCIGLAVRK